MDRAREQIAASVEATLAEQARQNEIRLNYVRLTCYGFLALLHVYFHYRPPPELPRFPLQNAAVVVAWFGLYLILDAQLRRGRWYAWFPVVLPALDGAAAISIAIVYWGSPLPPELDWSGVAAVLLAASSGLRFRRDSIVVSLIAAITFFLFVQISNDLPTARAPFVLLVIAGAAVLAYWMSLVVERAMTAEVARQTLSRFLPAEVVREAHRDPVSLLSEPRDVDATIVITDVRGFATLAENMSPGATMAFLNEIQSALAAEVWRRGGTVDKFMGDGMLAVFGALGDPDDHAGRALETTAAILDAVAAINERSRQADRPEIEVGVGVHSGPVVVGCLGSGRYLELTVVGDTVNLASRLESATKDLATPVLISRATLDLAGDPRGLDLAPHGDLDVRGRRAPVDVLALRDR